MLPIIIASKQKHGNYMDSSGSIDMK